MIIPIQEIKRRGGAAIKDGFKHDSIILISIGEKKYPLLSEEEYNKFREYELERAYEESKRDIENGDYKILTAEEHFEELGI